MNKLVLFVQGVSKASGSVAPIPTGITVKGRTYASQCQCDCHECAGGDTTEDR